MRAQEHKAALEAAEKKAKEHLILIPILKSILIFILIFVLKLLLIFILILILI